MWVQAVSAAFSTDSGPRMSGVSRETSCSREPRTLASQPCRMTAVTRMRASISARSRTVGPNGARTELAPVFGASPRAARSLV